MQENLTTHRFSVVFAESDQIENALANEGATLALQAPFHLSDEDAYFVLPDDIGMEIIDIMEDRDNDLLMESLRDGALVLGSVETKGKENYVLTANYAINPKVALQSGLPYAAEVEVLPGRDPLPDLIGLPHVQCTVGSELIDDVGLDKVLRKHEYLGRGWTSPPEATADQQGEPTYIWSKHLGPGQIGIELALFQEYEELVTLFRPVKLVATDL